MDELYSTSTQGAKRAIETVGAGVVAGTLIDWVMPQFDEESSHAEALMQLTQQVVLNGVMIVLVSRTFQRNDPTGGGLFFPALLHGQPGFLLRLDWATNYVRDRIDHFTDLSLTSKPN